MDNKFCPYCGAQNPSVAQFCIKCGGSFTYLQKDDKQKHKLKEIAIVFIALAAIFSLYAYMTPNRPEPVNVVTWKYGTLKQDTLLCKYKDVAEEVRDAANNNNMRHIEKLIANEEAIPIIKGTSMKYDESVDAPAGLVWGIVVSGIAEGRNGYFPKSCLNK